MGGGAVLFCSPNAVSASDPPHLFVPGTFSVFPLDEPVIQNRIQIFGYVFLKWKYSIDLYLNGWSVDNSNENSTAHHHGGIFESDENRNWYYGVVIARQRGSSFLLTEEFSSDTHQRTT